MIAMIAVALLAFMVGAVVGAWWGHRLGVEVTEQRWAEAVHRALQRARYDYWSTRT